MEDKYSERELNEAAATCLSAPMLFDHQYKGVGKLVEMLAKHHPAIEHLKSRHFQLRRKK